MYKIERVARETYRTSRPDGRLDILGRYATVKVPARPCSRSLHSGPIIIYLEDYVLTIEEKSAIAASVVSSGGMNHRLPRQQDLITEVLATGTNNG